MTLSSPNATAKSGRAPEYTAEHFVRLERIKRLQADGHTLFEIGRILRCPSAAKSAMEPPEQRHNNHYHDDDSDGLFAGRGRHQKPIHSNGFSGRCFGFYRVSHFD